MANRAVFLPEGMRSAYSAKTAGSAIGSGRNEGMATFTISKQTFEDIEDLIEKIEGSQVKMRAGLDILVRQMVYTIKGYAQEQSAGPVASRQRSNPAMANRIPVQRITGAYFAGWKIQKVANAHWMLSNTSKEAYLIEYGIHQRQRRPVLKTSTVKMLEFVQTTRTGQRFLTSVMSFRLANTALDLPNRGADNPNISGPSGVLP